MRPSHETAFWRIGTHFALDEPLVDVVFVHGLSGDGTSTWAAPDATESWLNWLAEDIPSIAVWSLSYPATATKWTSGGEGMALPDRAANLLPTMLHYGIGERNIVFVCHSLGGLVVKQMLRHAAEMAVPEWGSISASTLGVVFLATPHSGSNLATFARLIKMPRATRNTLALTAHSPHLKELGDWYRQNATRLGIQTSAYAENNRVRRGFRLVTVVTTTSANPGVEGCITTSLDADHISICKPASRESDAYRGVKSFIQKQIARTLAPPRSHGLGGGPVPSPGQEPSLSADPPPADLVRQIRELQAMGQMNLIDPFEVSKLKMGILSKHYGVNDE